MTDEQQQLYDQQLIKLKNFQSSGNYALHPIRGKDRMSLEQWAYLMLDIKRCPCDGNRKECPCSQASDEIIKLGHCHCRLFWNSNSDAYKEYAEAAKKYKK